MVGLGEGARNMKSMWLPSVAIFFMDSATDFHRYAGGFRQVLEFETRASVDPRLPPPLPSHSVFFLPCQWRIQGFPDGGVSTSEYDEKNPLLHLLYTFKS